jgi:cytochrome P450
MTVFHQLLHPDAAEGHVVPSVEELVDEAFTIIGAASETTGNALTIATYHILANEKIYSKLKAELKGSFPNPSSRLDFVELEKLPYLVRLAGLHRKLC